MRAPRTLSRAPIRVFILHRIAFVAVLIVAIHLASIGATSAAELVVCVRDAAPSRAANGIAARITVAPPGLTRERLADRARSLGLTLERGLLDGLGVSPPPGAAGNPFDLDPARVFLLSAPDSARLARAAAVLAVDPRVEWLDGVATREAAVLSPDDPLLRDGRQWGLANLGPSGPYGGIAGADIGALAAWSRSVGSRDVLLVVADTGIDPRHPDLAASFPFGERITLGIDVTEAGGSWADSTGHGTLVAGVMAARTGNGAVFDSLGIAGVCGGDGAENPGCRIVPIKIAPGHTLTASSFDVARAIVYAVAIGARAVNLSFASPARSRVEQLALYYAIVRGCVVVAASGNQGARAGATPQYPACYAVDGLCVQVGAMDPRQDRAVFSSYGPGLDVLAPGVQVWSTSPTYALPSGAPAIGYLAGSGTSLAAPFATGTIGLLAAARPELQDSDFQRLIRAGARDLGATGRDPETGWGALDAGAALARVGSGIGVRHDEVAADRFEDMETDTLVIAEPGPGALERARTWPQARRVAAYATVSLPDSFHDSADVWPRVGGTMAVRGDWRMPYFSPFAEVVERSGRRVTFRGYLFRVELDGTEDLWLPLPADQARFGYTVIGPVRGRLGVPFSPRVALAAQPNPFTLETRVLHPPGASLVIVDAGGRLVRRLAPSAASTTTVWDGRDDARRPAPAGLYWIECRTRLGSGSTRVLRLN